jgi:CO/xanthine dehydrogenase FAD-binding subunit
VSVGCLVKLDEKGRIRDLRMTIGGIADIPLLLQGQVNNCIGKEPNRELLKEVTEGIIGKLEPPSDLHATADYRIDLLRKLIPETVLEACARIYKGGR